MHWRAPGGVGWLRLVPRTPADARVDAAGTLHLTGSRLRFEAYAPAGPHPVTAAEWRFPGLTVQLSPTENLEVMVTRSADLLRIEYTPSPTTLVLHLSAR